MSASSGRRLTRALKQLKLPAEQGAGPVSVEITTTLDELDGEGFSLAAAADVLPRIQLMVLRLSAPDAADESTTRTFLRRPDGLRATRLPDSGPVACLADLRAQHPDDVLLVWVPEDVAAPAALIRAGANIVIAHVQKSGFSIRMVKGHPVVRLGSTIDTGTETTQHADVRWTPHLTRSSDNRRLLLEFDVRAVSGRRSRPLTEDEIARAYVDALRSTTVTDSVLEHVDAAATKKTSHVALSLTLRGRLARNASGGFPQAPILWNERGDTLEATSNHLVSPRIVQYEMDRAGLETEYLTKNFLIADDHDGAPIGYYISSGRNSPHTAVRTVGDKNLTRSLLSSAGIPVARGRYFADEGQVEAALELMAELAAVVVKPVDAAQGRGVSVDVRTVESFRRAWKTAFEVARTGVIVEKHFTGDEARFTVVDDHVVGVTRSRQPSITGDGKRTVRELLIELNERRRANPHLANRPVDLNEGRIARMLEHGLHPLSVLSDGEEFVVGLSTGWYGGAETEDITESVHPSYLQAVVKAVRTVPGLTVAGLDVMLEDYRVEATAENFIILEINSQPGLGIHHFPALGTARNAAGAIVRSDLAPRSPAAYTSPVAATSGTSEIPAGADPTTAGFAEALQARGFSVVWHAPDVVHAEAQGITTAFHGSYSAMTGKSGVIGARQSRVFAKLLERAGVPHGTGWKLFSRDAEPADFSNGARAIAHARTLTSPALRTAAGMIRAVEAEHEESFAEQWRDLSRRTSSGIAVLDVDLSTLHRFLIAYGEVITVLGPDDAPAEAVSAGAAAAYGETAARAVAAFPGLDIAEVTVSVTDPAAAPDASNHAVLAVRPGRSLVPFGHGSDKGEPSLFDRITDLHVTHLPKAAGVS